MTGSRPQSTSSTTPIPSLPPEFDYEAYVSLKQHEAVIKQQLEQAEEDIRTLKTLKEQANANPTAFIKNIKNIKFPRLQNLIPIPFIDIGKYKRKASRRISTPYGQNLEYLLRRLAIIQEQPIQLKPLYTILDPLPEVTTMRARFAEILGPDYQNLVNKGGLTESDIQSELTSRVASPAPLLSYKTSTRTPVMTIPQPSQVVAHDLPATYRAKWTHAEKRKFEQLMIRYQDEPVAQRKYEKIAAVLGTRTVNQVLSRVTKLAAKAGARERSKEVQRIDVLLDKWNALQTKLDEKTKKSLEYTRLQNRAKQLTRARHILHIGESIAIHWGEVCALCQSSPIIGTRWQCLTCPEQPSVCDESDCKGKHESHQLVRLDVPAEANEAPKAIGMWKHRPAQYDDDEFAYLDPSRA